MREYKKMTSLAIFHRKLTSKALDTKVFLNLTNKQKKKKKETVEPYIVVSFFQFRTDILNGT